jgi:hypothetical protein
MINFFRKIRRELMSQNKVTRYLAYALGEIALVVIGILIALQIDTWNEEKKVEKSIASHLVILRQNLKEDQAQLRELKSMMTSSVHYADTALLQMRTQIPMSKSLKKHLGMLELEHQFRPNRNAFETITQSNEVPSLSQPLQTALLDYYALIARVNEREQIANNQIQGKYEPYINEHYPEIFQKDSEWEFVKNAYKDDPREIVQIAPEKFLADHTMEALLVARYYQSMMLEAYYVDLLHASDEILGLIGENTKEPHDPLP